MLRCFSLLLAASAVIITAEPSPLPLRPTSSTFLAHPSILRLSDLLLCAPLSPLLAHSYFSVFNSPFNVTLSLILLLPPSPFTTQNRPGGLSATPSRNGRRSTKAGSSGPWSRGPGVGTPAPGIVPSSPCFIWLTATKVRALKRRDAQ